MDNIVYVLPYLEKGGTETHVLELIKGFQDKYNITLIAPPGPRLREFKKYNIEYLPFTSLNINIFKGIREFKENLKEIKKIKPGLIHIHAAHEFVLLTRLFIKKVPIIFTDHGYHGSLNKIDYKISSIINNLWSKKVIVISKAEKKLFQEAGLKNEKMSLIHNGISLPGSFSADRLPERIKKMKENKVIIGTVARLEKAKGLAYLINALYRIKNYKAHLLIIGSGSMERELKKLVTQLSIDDRVSFIGYVDNVHDYLEIMDIFVLPSLQEPFGLVCAEAMAHRLPVIATSTGGIPEVVENKETGILVPPANSKKLAEALELLLEDRIMRKKLGQKGYQRYKAYFTLEHFLARTEKVYSEYLNGFERSNTK